MSEGVPLSRRALLRHIGVSVSLSAAGAGVVTAQTAEHVHHAVATETRSGAYRPKFFNAAEYATMRRLADLVVPGSLEGGAPEFIDFLCAGCPDLAEIYTGGLAWLDAQMNKRYRATFAAAQPQQQTAMLELIAYRKNDSPELGPGIRFFEWLRNMTVDAYYSSAVGMRELGYMGNSAMSHFEVPEEAVEYALRRSPFAADRKK